MRRFRLGRLPARHDPRTLKLGDYLRPQLPPVPAQIDRLKPVKKWQMFANDAAGDCVEAGGAHGAIAFAANAGRTISIADADVVTAYSQLTGFDPSQQGADGSNPTDNGTALLDFMNYWRTTGIAGHNIGAFVAVNPLNLVEVKAAIYLFDGLLCGHNLPLSAQPQFAGHKAWTPVPGPNGQPGSWGGHCTWVGAATKTRLRCVTWARVQSMTRGFWTATTDEAYAAISTDMLDRTGHSPTGLDVAALTADLKAVTD